MLLKKFIFIPLLLLTSTVFANNKDSVHYRHLSFDYANDVFWGSDRYLTQQINLCYSPGIQPLSTSQTIWRIQQQVFTPSDIFSDTIQKNDRPYAALLSISFNKNKYHATKQLLIHYTVSFGAIGHYAYGEQTQYNIHKALGNRQARGWQYQIHSAPYVNLQASIDANIIKTSRVELLISGKANAGNIYNHADAGIILHFHKNNPYFIFERNRLQHFRVSSTLNSNIRCVAYNGTLQGSIAGVKSQYTLQASEISNIVLQQTVLFTLGYKNFELELSATSLTKEFKTGKGHQWSALKFTYIF